MAPDPEAVVVVDDSVTMFVSAACRDALVFNMVPVAMMNASEQVDFILYLIWVVDLLFLNMADTLTAAPTSSHGVLPYLPKVPPVQP
jgi:predicted nucleotidyltransferase